MKIYPTFSNLYFLYFSEVFTYLLGGTSADANLGGGICRKREEKEGNGKLNGKIYPLKRGGG
jgi:hypothetical protein